MKTNRKPGHIARLALWMILLLLAVTVIFCLLYRHFLFDREMYAYVDIGGDTVTSYLPQMVFDLRSFARGTVDMYRLDKGLGEYYPNLLYKYLNGVNLPILFFGEGRLHWGVLIATWLKYCVIAAFGGLFFRRLFQNSKIAFACALLWAYAGYGVLWGQHYHLLTSIAAFTILIYGLQLVLEGSRRWYFFIPAAACLAYTGYYYLWMGSFFVLFYSISYVILKKIPFREILKKAALAIFCMGYSLLVAGEYILPSAVDILESTRISVIRGEEMDQLFYTKEYMAALLGRVFSSNLFGAGSDYSGDANYYEIAILCVGILFIFCIIVLLSSPMWKQTVVFLAMGTLSLLFPAVSKVISMRSTTQRWTFILQLAMIIAIGYGLRYLYRTRERVKYARMVLRSWLITDAILCGAMAFFWYFQEALEITVDPDAVIRIFLILGIYHAAFLAPLVSLLAQTADRMRIRRRWMAAVCLAVCAEMVIANDATINDRRNISIQRWREEMYYDGTENVTALLDYLDDSLYRVGKTYESVSRNDEMIQGYRGISVYNSLNAYWLTHFYETMGHDVVNTETKTGSNYITFTSTNVLESGLLGVRYIIGKAGKGFLMPGWEPVSEDEKYAVYKNEDITSFGYLYDTRIDPKLLAQCSPVERKLLLGTGYFLTEDTAEIEKREQEAKKNAEQTELTEMPFTEEVINPQSGYYRVNLLNADFNGQQAGILRADDYIKVIGRGSDMALRFNQFEFPEKNRLLRLTIEIETEKACRLQLYTAQPDVGFNEKNSSTIDLEEGYGIYSIDLSSLVDVERFRLDPSDLTQTVTIHSAWLEYQDRNAIVENIAALYQNGTVDLYQEGNLFSGTVMNPAAETRMLCIPMIYNDRWEAKLDGDTVEVANINGGLLGIEMPSGEHVIQLSYRYDAPKYGRLLGAVSTGLFVLFAVIMEIVRYRKNRRPRRIHTAAAQETVS